MLFKQPPDTKEAERPWQADIDRLQKTLQEVLQAISSLSGVELAGAAPGSETPDNPTPAAESKSLKDRIRSDLEAFAATTASEMARQAERQTRAALAAIHSEASGQVEEAARELRERLRGEFEPGNFEIGITQQTQDRIAELVQRRTDEFARWVWLMCKGTETPIPEQIGKLLEPYVEQATGKFTESFRQQFTNKLVEEEQLAQQRLQGILNSFKDQVNSLEQSAQKVCEQSVDSAAKSSADRLNAVAEDAVKNVGGRIREQIESEFAVFQKRLEGAVEVMREKVRQEEDQKEEAFRNRIAGLESEAEEKAFSHIAGRVEQAAASVIESSIQNLQQRSDDTLGHSKEELKGFLDHQMEETRVKIDALSQSVHESLSQAAEQRAGGLRKLDEEIAGVRDKNIAGSRDQLATIVQETMESTKERIRQMSNAQLEEINRFVRESQEAAAVQYDSQLRSITGGWYNKLLERLQMDAKEAGAKVSGEVKANSDSVMQELSDKVDASALVLREETAQATSRIESTLKASIETYQQQLTRIADNQFDQHRQAIRKSLTDLQSRLERSAQALRQEIAGKFEANPEESPSNDPPTPEEPAEN